MQKVIVVGATSGIGKQLAILLAKNGYQVGVTGRRSELLEELRRNYPNNIIASSFDVTHTFDVSKMLEALMKELGGLDLFIFSAGVGDFNHELQFAIEKQTIDVNISGFTEAIDWAYNFFERQKQGHLVAITSLAGIRGSSLAPAYNATKAYQINYLEGVRQKAKKSKHALFVTDIRPGFVDTQMAKGEGRFWVASVDKAASQIFDAIRRRKAVAYVTRRWGIIAGLLKIIPGKIYQRL